VTEDPPTGLGVAGGVAGDEAATGVDGEHHGPFFFTCLLVGWGVIVFGLHGMVANGGQANPPALFRLLIGLNIVNDALVIPGVIALGYLARRHLPGWLLMPVQVGLITSAVVVLYAYPLLGGWGRSARAGASRLPWDYGHNLAVVLLAVWVLCAGLALWSRRHPASARR
jgi:hypothetical protein